MWADGVSLLLDWTFLPAEQWWGDKKKEIWNSPQSVDSIYLCGTFFFFSFSLSFHFPLSNTHKFLSFSIYPLLAQIIQCAPTHPLFSLSLTTLIFLANILLSVQQLYTHILLTSFTLMSSSHFLNWISLEVRPEQAHYHHIITFI